MITSAPYYREQPYIAAAYNHDRSCLEQYAALGIDEIWAGVYMPGKCLFGTGRLQRENTDRTVTYEELGEDFAEAKRLGIRTTFLLNPACTGNVEFTNEGMSELAHIIAFLRKYRVDHITISQPFLTRVFKRICPEVAVKISSHYNVDSIGKFRFMFDQLGADLVIVSQFANKNFRLLRQAVKRWDPSRFEIMGTVPCMAGCPYRSWHAQFYGHSNALPAGDHVPVPVPCLAMNHHNPSVAISAMFVRREDLHYYQQLGINKFKVGERRDPTQNNLACLRYYAGEQTDYVPFFRRSPALNKMNLAALDGFYDKFFNEECDCMQFDCRDCDHCSSYARKVFTFTDDDIAKTRIPDVPEYFDTVLTGKWVQQIEKLYRDAR